MRYRGGMSSVHPTPSLPASLPDACLNCAAPFDPAGPRPRFCPVCGQESNVAPPTVAEFVQQFGGAYFSTEGAMWRTLKLLLTQPGELTRQYRLGRRKHYVLPLRLYLTVSLIVLLIVRGTAALQVKVDPGDLPQVRPRDIAIDLGPGRAGLKDGVFFCDRLPQWLCQRVQRRLDIEPARFEQEAVAVGDRFIANLGAAMFLLLPSFALWFKLVYWQRRLRYTEHLVFALHLHAFWFLMAVLILSNRAWLAAPAVLAMPIYTLLAMRKVYGGRWWPRLLRAALVSVLYGLTMSVALTGLALWAILA
jgi:hypothetical protein